MREMYMSDFDLNLDNYDYQDLLKMFSISNKSSKRIQRTNRSRTTQNPHAQSKVQRAQVDYKDKSVL